MPELNRRNALIGMGGLAIGGGVLLGSGAFTTVEAERDVEVNIVTDTDIGDSDQFADVLINVGGFNSVAVEEEDGETLNTDGSDLFPDSDDNYGTVDDTDFNENYVSLLQNDVKIVFGFEDGDNDQRLLPNTTVEYEDLIALVNTNLDQETDGEHTLSFGNAEENGGFEGDTDVSFEDGPENEQVEADSALEFTVNVETDDEIETDTAEGDFLIEITESEAQ